MLFETLICIEKNYDMAVPKPKCIVFISNHGDFIGGGEYSFVDLVEKLNSTYHAVAVAPWAGAVIERFRQLFIPTRVVFLPSIRPWNIHRIVFAVIALVKAGRRVRARLLYANGPRSAFYAGLSSRILGLPAVWHCRVAEKDPYLDPVLVRLCSVIVANSKATANRFSPKIQKKVRVVYNGIPLGRFLSGFPSFNTGANKRDRILLVVARVSKAKRHDIALTVFNRLSERFKNLHLVCIGAKDPNEPDWWDDLMDRTRRARFPERIHWLGHLDDPSSWFAAASILLHPSENEGFGRVFVEAMAAGTPVVGSRSGGVPEIVRDGKDGFLARPGDADDFCDAVRRLLEDEALHRQCSENARIRARSFSLERHVQAMTMLVEQALDGSI